MGTSEKVNKESCYVTLIYTKLVSLDRDLKKCYEVLRTVDSDHKVQAVKDHIKYFVNEKRFWFIELKKHLDNLIY